MGLAKDVGLAVGFTAALATLAISTMDSALGFTFAVNLATAFPFIASGFVINFLVGFAFLPGFNVDFFATRFFAAAFDTTFAFILAFVFDFIAITHILS
jgi:hypothetical protein